MAALLTFHRTDREFMGEFRIELTGLHRRHVERLKAIGLMSEVISWKRRPFVPTGASGPVMPTKADRAPLARAHR